MLSSDIRKVFLNYFVKNQHTLVESSSLIPHNDDTLLFTNSGMVQFKNMFTGLEKASYSKATSSQQCLRAGGKHNDLDNVGYTARHHTFFEMLGNFSFGDYFKEEAIYHAWQIINKEFKLNKDKLLVTVYHNDDEAFNLWKSIAGFSDDKIIRINSNDNFWSMGEFGPCGPCSEIFYDYGENVKGGKPGSIDQDGDRFLEIWNIVFMQYEKLKDGREIPLKNPCIDTGMGLERIASVLQGKQDNYDGDLFKALMEAQESMFKLSINVENKASFKVIADHIRAISFMIAYGIIPSNEGRGYVLRRIIRRAVRYAYMLGISEPILYKLVPVLKNSMGKDFKDLVMREHFIYETLKQEEIKFHETFTQGIKLLNEELDKPRDGKIFSGKTAFKLYDTYGFPIDLTEDVLRGKNLQLDKDEFNKSFDNHRNLSKESWQGSGENKEDPIWFKISETVQPTKFTGHDKHKDESIVVKLIKVTNKELSFVDSLQADDTGYIIVENTPFYAEMGGQVGDKGFIVNDSFRCEVLDTQKRHGDIIVHKVYVEQGTVSINSKVVLAIDVNIRQQITAHHSAAHLLHCALRKYVGDSITQQGSMVNEQRLRFDVSHSKPFTEYELNLVEESINKVILANYEIVIEDMELEKAIKKGAMALFGEKYPKIARTVSMGNLETKDSGLYSFELCGGTHLKTTGGIGTFKIISEGSIASGVRRIEAVCGLTALSYYNDITTKVKSISKKLNIDVKHIEEKILSIYEENKKLKKDYENLYTKYHVGMLKNNIVSSNGSNYLCQMIDGVESKDLRNIVSMLIDSQDKLICLLFIKNSNNVSFMLGCSKSVDLNTFKTLHSSFMELTGGSGGGAKNMYQGVCNSFNLEAVKNLLASY